LSGRGLCDELITRPEESYRLCCVVVCDLETSRMGAPYIYDIRSLRVKVLIMIIVCKSNDDEISLNFKSIYLILQFTLYSFLQCYISCDLKMA